MLVRPRDIDNCAELLRLDHPRLVLPRPIRLYKAPPTDNSLVCYIDNLLIHHGNSSYRLGLLAHYLPRLGSAWRGHCLQPILYPQLFSIGDLYPLLRQRVLQRLPTATVLFGVVQLGWSKGVFAPWRTWNHDALCRMVGL